MTICIKFPNEKPDIKILFTILMRAKHGGACLSSQHSGGRDRQVSVSLRTKGSLDYTVDSRSATTKTVMNSLGTDQNENKVQET